jgi:DNA invertase Pin-like site-specific DNA recombinase
MTNHIAYYRVSTQQQGRSGLGLEAQRQAVRSFLKDGHLLKAEFTEIESGKRDTRPQLTAAIAQAQQIGATLLIAKLDRLSRNAGFIFALRDSGVKFLAVDMPDANHLTVGILAVIADHERQAISDRTKAALGALKARGVQLGSPENLTSAAREKAIAVLRRNAYHHPQNKRAGAYALSLHQQGRTLSGIAAELNTHGFTTRRGKQFHAMQVKRLIERYGSGLVTD